MSKPARHVALAGTILAFAAVLLAALGSHAIDMNGMQALWQTASSIHMFHAAAVLGLAALLSNRESPSLKAGVWLIFLGTVVFSGSIYLHVVTGYKVPLVTPAGGFLMLGGWLSAVMAFLRES